MNVSMPIGVRLFRHGVALASALTIVCATSHAPSAQAVPPIDRRITYVLPQWLEFLGASDVPQQVARLRSTLGEGPRVRVGFTTYIAIVMAPVDPDDPAAVRAALGPTVAQVDEAIARAQASGIPICLSFATALRSGTDALEVAAQAEDRRNMQWHADNTLAAGWSTFSRYARKQERLQEAFVRELGRVLANRMFRYPDIIVAASGDGEIELSGEHATVDSAGKVDNVADYSPFAIAEFRDWLRGRGLYAPGQPFAGEAYASASRYASDASLSTLNADFNLNFDNWNLKNYNWSLSDDPLNDPHAIPTAEVGTGAFQPPAVNPFGFDAPRTHLRGDPWSDLWDQFRARMVWRHNLAFAKWITTSADPATGATVPAERWFSDQIPADYLFGGTPANPNGRLDTSASPIWTADISPFGSAGITAFNVNYGSGYHRTLAGAAPVMAARRVRWGVFEWNPSVGPSATREIYDQEMALVEQYRPSLLAPFVWNASASYSDYRVDGSPFADSLRDLITRLNNVPLTLSDTSIDIGATTNGAANTPPQTIRVSGAPGESPPWTIASAPSFVDVSVGADGRSFTVALKPGTYGAGTVPGQVVVNPTEPGYAAATLDVTLRVVLPSAATPPQGAVDSPADGALVGGEVAVTGWAVDDLGVASVKVYRNPVAGEGTALVFVGDATFVPSARPDVEAGFPGRPRNERAGWGYMLLTNMLPGGGNTTFTLTAIAIDVEGHQTVIGQRQIVCQNSLSPVPFGTIDSPLQGEIVSGTIINFGWALTGQPRSIPLDGSTIDVYIDGVLVGHPTYGFPRADIQALFPGYANTDSAVGFYTLDTTQLSNGLHSIFWIVRDNTGAAAGIGSRYFTVANP
jgi:hypothetical protein